MYKRMKKNPSYYDCQGVSYTDMSVHLSELGDDTVTDLQAKNCVGGIDRFFTTELGKMASKFCISYKTMASFSASLTPATTNFKDLLNILSNASEYDVLPIRLGIEEEKEICWLLNNQRFSYKNSIVRDPHVIANALIQAHLSRKFISQNLVLGQRYVLSFAVKLLQAIIAITSKKNWLKPTFLAISFNQFLIQATWEYESDVLLQVPHLTKELVLKCGEKDIKYLEDFVEMEHSERREMLNMSGSKLLDIDRFFRHVFIPEFLHKVKKVDINSERIEVSIKFEIESDREFVHAPFFPTIQNKRWWAICCNLDDPSYPFQLKSIQAGESCIMKFSTPNQEGRTTCYGIYFQCNGYRALSPPPGRLYMEVKGDEFRIRQKNLVLRWSLSNGQALQ